MDDVSLIYYFSSNQSIHIALLQTSSLPYCRPTDVVSCCSRPNMCDYFWLLRLRVACYRAAHYLYACNIQCFTSDLIVSSKSHYYFAFRCYVSRIKKSPTWEWINILSPLQHSNVLMQIKLLISKEIYATKPKPQQTYFRIQRHFQNYFFTQPTWCLWCSFVEIVIAKCISHKFLIVSV